MHKNITIARAINEALSDEMQRNEDIVYFGIDVRVGANGGITKGLVAKFGEDRIVNTPIAESSIVGIGIGMAIGGLRAVVELMFEDFAMLAMDHLYNNMGTWNYLTNGQYKIPLTVISISGTGEGIGSGPGHGQALQPVLMSAPGISICVPSNPYDAKGLIVTALRANNPVFYSVSRVLLGSVRDNIPGEEYAVPFGKAKIVKRGKDVTVVAIGSMVHQVLASAAELEKDGIKIEIIDPRTLAPLDKNTILKSVAKTGRLVVAEESRIINGVGAEILAVVSSENPALLKKPAKRVAAPMLPIPAAAALEKLYLPNSDDINRVVRELVSK